ncbi:alpha-crystallin A chain-like [Cloeon dipterum]|uniref:alpha-crystallin A chain-like n=1 Tax=Cloeon dipterum TaxID=197152 RepID=UPI003220586B
MSLLPLLVNLQQQLPTVMKLYDQNFGMGLLDEELPLALHGGYPARPWRCLSSGVSTVARKSSDFHVNLDVQQFKPNEINASVEDNFLIIEAKHEERQDQHGFITREFVRKYKLPDDLDKTKVDCKLSSDGVLTVTIPKLSAEVPKAHIINIQVTNQPALRTEKGEKEEKKSEQEEKKSAEQGKEDKAEGKEDKAEKKAEKTKST